ncbi:MAG: Uncharacterized protein XD43_0748 [Thermococcales archaeon 44_46]|uniref:eCIS core domain-containing protein n=1 Tax=Thermococcus sp. PK TaxID=913025 RepID=UPI0005B2E4AC|nr:DUF4157 domain-containing protein [Thermococcus sp. PK]KUJ99588.1 MAG: Uncharacterized protein XD43_0748 [Thermococcales archaeon 44_46]
MRNKSLLALFLIGIFFIAFLYHNYSYPSEDAQQVLQIASNISKEVEEIRGLSFKENPKIIVLTKEEALKKWGPSREDYQEIKKWELIYKMTFLVPPDYNLTKTREKETASWIAVTSGNKVYIISENFFKTGDTAKRVLAHEFTHVIQKQYFDPKYPETLDGSLAIKALIEGDADLTADLYCKKHGIRIEKITSLYLKDPPINFGYFPYVFGDKFVEYLYQKGGWELVNEAYTNPPQTTQQIMHPELYLAKVLPQEVEISLGRDYRIIHEDRLGEFYFYLLLVTNGVDQEEASRISIAWRGDRIILAENSTHYLVIWKSLWNDDRALQEIQNLLTKKANESTKVEAQVTVSGNELMLKTILPKQ